MTNREIALKISLKKGFGPRSYIELKNVVGDLPNLSYVNDVKYKELAEYIDSRNDYLEDLLRKMAQLNIRYVTLEDESYPNFLRNIYDPPIVLYYKGSLDISDISWDKTISIVGSRNLDSYGKSQTISFANYISQSDVIVVSGMAFGADALAHESALGNGRATIAILASSVDIATPGANIRLYNEILKNGLVISEYPPTTYPVAGNFPARNRIVAGISRATLVTQARIDSGSMITPKLAFEFGKEVFAIPGNLGNSNHSGTNQLISQDIAKLITSADDVLKTYLLDNPNRSLYLKEKPISLTDEIQAKIYELLKTGINNFHDLILQIDISSAELNSELSMMELQDIVKIIDQKIYLC